MNSLNYNLSLLNCSRSTSVAFHMISFAARCRHGEQIVIDMRKLIELSSLFIDLSCSFLQCDNVYGLIRPPVHFIAFCQSPQSTYDMVDT